MFYYDKSLKIRLELNDRNGILSVKTNMASLYTKLNQADLALKFAFEALKESLELKTIADSKNIYQIIAKAYSIKQNYKEAYFYQNLHLKFKDSLFTQETSKQIAEMSTKYETEKKENQILLLKKDKQVQIAETKKQKIIKITFIVGFVIVLFVTIYIINRLLIIKKQKLLIEKQKQLVDEKNREITDSITYAKRIQSAILPQKKLIKESLQNSFILYKPKDIVAGDFYWMETTKNGVIFAAADCTGHGVPGAMVSVVCHNALNRSVREFGFSDPALILNKTREIVVSEFEKSESDVKDGMDISLCNLNFNTLELIWAGANNPLWIIRNNEQNTPELIEFKPDKQPIGKYFKEKPFTSHHIQLKKQDNIYIFTDGFQDQFGGPESSLGGKKFKVAQFKDILLKNSSLNMTQLSEIIDECFENWKGKLDQVDDVCVIGIKV